MTVLCLYALFSAEERLDSRALGMKFGVIQRSVHALTEEASQALIACGKEAGGNSELYPPVEYHVNPEGYYLVE